MKLSNHVSSLPISLCLVCAALNGCTQPRQESHSQTSPTSAPSTSGYVLPAGAGEVIKRKGNTVTVKVDPKTGSPNMAMGTQELDPGVGIPVHMHEHEDEVLFVHEGSGVAVLGDQRTEIGKGGTVFIPRGVWHGVESRGEAVEILWIVTPPGLESYFRETGSLPGSPPKELTPAQIEDIGRKHGTIFKPR